MYKPRKYLCIMIFAKAKCVLWELPVSSYWAKYTGSEEQSREDVSDAGMQAVYAVWGRGEEICSSL